MGFIVGIDGTAGSGKGTVAKRVANKLNLTNIDTGSTYRCVALAAIRKGLIKEEFIEEENVIKMLDEIKIQIENNPKGDKVYLNGEDVSEEIRSKEVSKSVSPISSIKKVRYKMVEIQRKMAEGKDIIMEGRDICTYVFPNADVKIYLDASVEARAKRRTREMKEKGIKMTYEEVLKNIEERDYKDKNKEMGALKVTPESIIIDTTELTIEEVEEKVIQIIKEKRGF